MSINTKLIKSEFKELARHCSKGHGYCDLNMYRDEHGDIIIECVTCCEDLIIIEEE